MTPGDHLRIEEAADSPHEIGTRDTVTTQIWSRTKKNYCLSDYNNTNTSMVWPDYIEHFKWIGFQKRQM